MGVLIAIFLLMAVSGIAYIFYKRYRSLLVTYSHDQKEIAALRSILALNQQVLQSKLLLDLCCGTDYRKEGIVKSIAFLKLEERLKCVSVVLIQVPVSIQLFYNLHKSESAAYMPDRFGQIFSVLLVMGKSRNNCWYIGYV